MLSFILPFIILILVVVFIHEYGHYYFAKKYGVGVTDFSIGFGKEIFGWNDKSGTRWKICWIPLGGYVKFFGDRNVFSKTDQEELLKKYNKEDQHKLFVTKPLYQRSLIVAGGPLANFILAIFIFFFIYMFVGKDFTPAVIDEVQKNSPAQIAGIQKNDIIVEIDNNKVESILEVSKLIMMSTSQYIDFKVLRYDQEIILKVKPNTIQTEDNLGNKINKRIVGIKIRPYKNEVNHVKLGPSKALVESFKEVYFVTSSSLKSLCREDLLTCPNSHLGLESLFCSSSTFDSNKKSSGPIFKLPGILKSISFTCACLLTRFFMNSVPAENTFLLRKKSVSTSRKTSRFLRGISSQIPARPSEEEFLKFQHPGYETNP